MLFLLDRKHYAHWIQTVVMGKHFYFEYSIIKCLLTRSQCLVGSSFNFFHDIILVPFFFPSGRERDWHMILAPIWHFFVHLQQQTMLLLSGLGETYCFLSYLKYKNLILVTNLLQNPTENRFIDLEIRWHLKWLKALDNCSSPWVGFFTLLVAKTFKLIILETRYNAVERSQLRSKPSIWLDKMWWSV